TRKPLRRPWLEPIGDRISACWTTIAGAIRRPPSALRAHKDPPRGHGSGTSRKPVDVLRLQPVAQSESFPTSTARFHPRRCAYVLRLSSGPRLHFRTSSDYFVESVLNLYF